MKRYAVALVHHLWYRHSPLALLFIPFSLVFGVIVRLRRMAYQRGWLKREALGVPVIVVGNLIAGGAGKTPLVLWLVEELQKRGWRPGILSRGYQGQNAIPHAVMCGADPVEAGDEPVLLAERSGVPVWIGRRRVAAGRALLAAHPQCNVIVCDDGLQHYALARNFEIAVEDERRHGNGWLLPAGPLREPASRAVDATVTNGTQRQGAYAMHFKPAVFYPLHAAQQVIPVEVLRGQRLHAVAGIGNPERFFAQLEALGLRFVPHAFPDHFRYRADDLQFPNCDTILMTEKDAVKCRAFGRTDLVALRIEAVVDPALADLIETRLNGSATA